MTLNFKKYSSILKLALPAIITLFLHGCGVYSFTGASISPEARTISIQQFPNNAPLVQPMLSQLLTDALRDKFAAQTSLSQVPVSGDLAFEGSITDYRTQPIAITSDDTPAQNRLTVSIRVTFTNRFDEKQNFEQTFSRYDDYDSSLALSEVEDQLIAYIIEALVQDVFNRSVVNW